ncbi:MAG: rhodanese-like domain-containing protein [Flavobacteriales bacterium AspAUS03]
MVRLDQAYYVHCDRGYRSVIATSILKERGFDQLINIEGGKTIKKNKICIV